MHPNPLFRSDDKDMMRALVEETAFGSVFLTAPDGPRAAHTPLLWGDGDKLRFHLSRANALTAHLDGATALVTVHGPNGYVSPRWYDERDTVPTWDYVAIELEGTVSMLSEDELDAFLYDMIEEHESRLGGDRWHSSETSEPMWENLLRGIRGFEMEVETWRPTFKLSQRKTPREQARIADGQKRAGNTALARMVEDFIA